MLNTDDFIKRLEIIFEFYGLSSSTFADKIGVQRSSLSHLLSGRNKPSLDFIMKIINVFPEIDLYWLLNGKGEFNTKSSVKNIVNSDVKISTTTPLSISVEKNLMEDVTQSVVEEKNNSEQILDINSHNKKTVRIVVFHSDGTFKEYQPE